MITDARTACTTARRTACAAALLGALLLSACAAPREVVPGAAPAGARAGAPAELPTALRLEPPPNDQASLLFGFMDMSGAPTPLAWMEFRQVAPRTETPYYQMRVFEGVFYMEKFPQGVFVMGEFGGPRRDGQHLAYSLPRTSPAVRIAVDRPGLYYVGAFRYRPVTEDGVKVGRFEIDRTGAPSAEEVLQRILPFARGTPWEARIAQRLAQGQ